MTHRFSTIELYTLDFCPRNEDYKLVAEKAKLKEKNVILNYDRIAKAVTCFINVLQTYNKKRQIQFYLND